MTSFTYSGPYSNSIPIDIQHLIITESVDYLPDELCRQRPQLEDIVCRCHTLRIGDRAFEFCPALTQVIFPNGLTSFGEYAFHRCGSLADVSLPEGLQKIGSRTFSHCFALKRIRVPSTVERIGNSAFSQCRSLSELILLEGLVKIGENAFTECFCLREIKFPSTVETIESSAFSRCTALIDIDLPMRLKMFSYAFSECSSLKEVEIPSGVETIDSGMFAGCASLTDVRLQEGLKRIGASSFSRTISLIKMKLPSTVTVIWDGAFTGCKSLLEVDLSHGLIKIGAHGFMDCVSLSRFRVPATTKTIDDFAFSGCLNLVSVEFAPSRKQTLSIGDWAFRNCKSLINIAVSLSTLSEPESVEIVQRAFEGCTCLEDRYGISVAAVVLEERFDKFPVHEQCYHSCDATVDDLRLAVESGVLEDGGNQDEWKHLADAFGMTPFHVLLSAASCRLDLLQLLLQTYPSFVLDWRDALGKRAIDHLSYIWTEETSLMMKAYLQTWLLDQLANWGSDQWRFDMAGRISDISSEENKERRDTGVREAYCALQRYEQVEARVLLELALWKKDMVSPASAALASGWDREGHQARCGAQFVVPNVMEFLEPVSAE